ncbi:MAG TPA: hypothetical protein VF388_05295 [Lacunisphaera sp.]
MKSVFDTAQSKDGRAFLKIIGPQARVTSLRKLERRKRVLAGLRKLVSPTRTKAVDVPVLTGNRIHYRKGQRVFGTTVIREAYTRLFELHPTKGWRSRHVTA